MIVAEVCKFSHDSSKGIFPYQQVKKSTIESFSIKRAWIVYYELDYLLRQYNSNERIDFLDIQASQISHICEIKEDASQK